MSNIINLLIGFILIGNFHLFSQSPLHERYHTLDEIYTQLQTWDDEFGDNTEPLSTYYTNSGIIYELIEIGQSTNDQLPIYAVKLSYNADQLSDKSKVLFLGQCHAEEIYGVEITMAIIEMFLNPEILLPTSGVSYVPSYTEINPFSDLADILENVEIWVIPTYNPEGLSVVHGWDDNGNWMQDLAYRKNKRDLNMNSVFDFVVGVGNDSDGVDLNRNYDFNWIFGDGIYEPDPGCQSYIANYDYYRGEAPFSESENQAIRDLAYEQQFQLSIAYHSSRSGCVSEKVIYSWEWEEGGKFSPDFPVISRLGDEIAVMTDSEDGGGSHYLSTTSKSRRGNAHDWLYSQTGCIQYLIEVGSSDLQPDDESLINETVKRNLRGAFHMIYRLSGKTSGTLGADQYQITGLVIDSETGEPVNAEVTIAEMDGGMLEPRFTHGNGRYRRLLYQGTYTLQVDAFGYEPYNYIFTPSSSSITEHHVSLQPKDSHSILLDISSSSTGIYIIGTIADGNFEENLQLGLGEEILNYPEGDYELTILATGMYPVHFNISLHSNLEYSIELFPEEIVFNDEFDNLDDWVVVSGDWVLSNGLLLTQSDLTYSSNTEQVIKLSTPITNNENTSMTYFLSIQGGYELEWDNDHLFFELTIGNNIETIMDLSEQHWLSDFLMIPFEIPANMQGELSIRLFSDQSVDYRGLHLDQLLVEKQGISSIVVVADLNEDGILDILDVVVGVNVIMGNIVPTEYILTEFDINDDGNHNILDLVIMVNIILN